MKTTTFWAIAGLAATAAAQDAPATTTAAGPAPSCTANLITTLCDYPEPELDFAVAADRASCWAYCVEHTDCQFVVFSEGNPYTGSGTCWLYPGQSFDASKGKDGGSCSHPWAFVYDTPKCSGLPPSYADSVPSQCSAAVAKPSPIAEVCGYPAPPGNCFYDCAAVENASQCLSLCAKKDSCNYAVFNAQSDSKSPYRMGNCWMYTEGSFDSKAGKACSGKTEQYVYKNTCPRPPPTSTLASLASSTAVGASAGSKTGEASPQGTAEGNGTNGAIFKDGASHTTNSHNAAPSALALHGGLAIGAAVIAWNGF